MLRARMRRWWEQLSRRALGALCLLGVVGIWVASAELIQFIFHDEQFDAPFFLTYFNTSLFGLYLGGFLVCPSWWRDMGGPPRLFFWLRLCQTRQRRLADAEAAEAALDDGLDVELIPLAAKKKDIDAADPDDHDHDNGGRHGSGPVQPLSLAAVVLIALGFCPLWFGANYFYNQSLSMSKGASSATILSSTSSLFTFCLGVALKVEVKSGWKLAGVLIALLGVILVSLVDFTGSGR